MKGEGDHEVTELTGGSAVPAGLLAWTYGRAGLEERARSFLPSPGSSGYISPMVPASVHLGLEEWDEAFTWLDRAIDARDPNLIPIKTLPSLDPIRDDPRFARLLQKMNLA